MRRAIRAKNHCPFKGIALQNSFHNSALFLHPWNRAPLQTNDSNRRLCSRRPDARSDRSRPKTSRLSGLSLSLWPGRAEEMETDFRELTHNRRGNRPFEERSPGRAGNAASPATHCDDSGSRHRHSAPSCAPSLAHEIACATSLQTAAAPFARRSSHQDSLHRLYPKIRSRSDQYNQDPSGHQRRGRPRG